MWLFIFASFKNNKEIENILYYNMIENIYIYVEAH